MAGYTTGQRMQINQQAKNKREALRRELGLYKSSLTDFLRRQYRRHLDKLLPESDSILRRAEALGLSNQRDVRNLASKDAEVRRVLGRPARQGAAQASRQAVTPPAAGGSAGAPPPRPSVSGGTGGKKPSVPVKFAAGAKKTAKPGKKAFKKIMPTTAMPGASADPSRLWAVLNTKFEQLMAAIKAGSLTAAGAEQNATNTVNGALIAPLLAQDYEGVVAWLQDAVNAFYQTEAEVQQYAAGQQQPYDPQYADQQSADQQLDYTYEDGTPASAEDIQAAQGQFTYDDSYYGNEPAQQTFGPYGSMTAEETDAANLEAQSEFDRPMEGLGTVTLDGRIKPALVVGGIGALLGAIVADTDRGSTAAVGGIIGVVIGFVVGRRPQA